MLDPQRVLAANHTHYGVIDIGSNSVRLVVYNGLSRAPLPRFNEKSLCALGTGLDRTGELAAGPMACTVRRFIASAPSPMRWASTGLISSRPKPSAGPATALS